MNKFQQEYDKLNPQQKEAVDNIEGPVMVIAGPGTGKTQILAMRIANILRQTQINPSNILCLTFTNSGVHAMKQRLLEIIGPASYQVHVHTFHQFCNEIIELFPEKFLIANQLNQLSDLEQIQLIQKILINNNFSKIKPFKSPYHYQNSIRHAINTLKQEDISPKDFENHIKNELDAFYKIEDLYHRTKPRQTSASAVPPLPEEGERMKSKYRDLKDQLEKNAELGKIYQKYQAYITEKGLYDYADMILFIVNAFREDSELLAHFQEKFQYILVDEYQDTNSAQNEIIELLGNFYEIPNIFAVGDDEQSIYRFQGASMENILFFTKKYPDTKIVILEHNYRSGQKILDASRALIKNNQNQIYNHFNISKNLKSQLKNITSDIHLGGFSNGSIENFFIAKEIQKLIKQGMAPSEIAVLYKEHRDAEELIDFLSKLDIPYKLEIGDNVIEDPEIGKILKYIQALELNGQESEMLVEIMHYPFLGISPLDIWKVIIKSRKEKTGIFNIITHPEKYNLELEIPEAIKEFVSNFLECRKFAYSNNFATSFEFIINKTGYLQYLISLKDNVRHFNRLQSLFEYIKQLNVKQKNLNLKTFLEHIALLRENNLPIKERELTAEYEGVNLMTAHKAKGLEFSYVFIMKATDKHWGNKTKKELIKLPSTLIKITRTSSEEGDEEERRLFYVALTRTKRSIYITYALSYGEAENQMFTIPSKFIGELPERYLKKINTKPFEKSFDERLKLTFGSKKWEYTQAMHDFLKKLVEDFKLNPTALNSYLDCPQQFLYDNILRVPKAKDFSQCYGTAIHRALEHFFRDYIKTLELPPKENLLKWLKDSLQYEIWDDKDQARALQNGAEILSSYYDFYTPIWKKQGRPLTCEMNFSSRNIHFGEIPITGIIDKIELMDKNAGLVRIVDYKTAAPKSLNFLMGKTKEQDTKYLYQAYFYKLLAESDPSFQWKIGEIAFDFVAPEKGKFKQVTIPVEQKDYDEFKKIVKEVYNNITKLNFPHNSQTCKKREGDCPYYPICHTNQNEQLRGKNA
ncbi:MAG: UvrD-helicase domain-containing protein [bacterium]|nr:UvrD-helicase domain-containing protein [bacterium]